MPRESTLRRVARISCKQRPTWRPLPRRLRGDEFIEGSLPQRPRQVAQALAFEAMSSSRPGEVLLAQRLPIRVGAVRLKGDRAVLSCEVIV